MQRLRCVKTQRDIADDQRDHDALEDAKAAAACGIATSAERLLLVDKLKELQSQQGRADLGLCN